MSFAHHPDGQYQQQQLLAAQQYQQLQYLQAQLAATTLQLQQQQQQQQQTQPMGSFIAPRFQALAAQRAAQQQQQQVQALAQARQLYELQQQQMLEYQRREDEARSRAIAEATLQNPPPVFEEDSPEPKPASLGPTGRPQLAPSFTFGKKTRGDSVSGEQVPMSPSREPPVINRSEGIGGAAATGLAGLAARAHKRTGSELSPAVQQQVSRK
jgi:protein SSD1